MELEIFGREGDTFTHREARALRVSDRTLARWVHVGRISRLGNGVYQVGLARSMDPRATSRGLKMAISFDSAAAWIGGDLPFAPPKLSLTAPRCRGRRADEIEGVRIHRADVPSTDLIVVRRALVTTPVRTALDVSHSMPLPIAVAIVDSLARRYLLTQAEFEQAALSLPRGPGRPAAVQAAALLDPMAESVFESMTRVNLAIAGLPAPASQLNIVDRDGRWIARVDFAWEALRVILECDGFEYHRDRDAYENDRRRWSALTRAGWRVVVVTWRDVVNDPAYLIDLMTDVLAA